MTYCISCGAAAPDSTSTFCQSCGAALPAAEPTEGEPKRQGGVPAWAKALVGVVGLGAIGFVVFSLLGGSSGRGGGAGSPESAVRQLVASIGDEDPLSALATLSPTEVRIAGDVYKSVEARVVEAKLGGTKSPYSGVDLELADVEVKVKELSDDVAHVEVTDAVLRYSVEPSELAPAYADLVAQSGADLSGEVDLADIIDGAPFEKITLMTVRDDGGWYVSPLYTAAEYLVEAADLPRGDFRDVAAHEREAPPKDAAGLMDALASEVSDLNVEATLQLISVDTLGIESVYADAIDELIDGLEEDLGVPIDQAFEVDVDEPEFTEESRDDLVILTLEEIRASGTVYDADSGDTTGGSFVFDGECLKTEDESGDSSEDCIDDAFFEQTGLPQPFVVAVKEDGGLRLSPIATLAEYLRIMAENMKTDTVLRAFDLTHLATPQAELTLGQEIPIKLTDSGTFVATFQGKAGQAVSFGIADIEGDVRIYTPAGEVEDYCWDDRSCVVKLEEDGAYRLVVTAYEYEGGEGAIGVHEIVPADTGFPGTIEGSNDVAGAAAAYRFTPGALFDYSTDSDLTFLDAEFENVFSEDIDPGDVVTLVVTSRGEFRVELAERPPLGFADGGFTANGAIREGEHAVLEMRAPAGALIFVEVTSDFDAVVSVLGPDGSVLDAADSVLGGDTEEVSFTAFGDGPFRLVIEGWESSSGSFQATMHEAGD